MLLVQFGCQQVVRYEVHNINIKVTIQFWRTSVGPWRRFAGLFIDPTTGFILWSHIMVCEVGTKWSIAENID